ncbi:MAG: type IV pilus assembly protein PilW [Gammaproteobacteria bacterium]|jgi:type IV pilus assembly protein PilW
MSTSSGHGHGQLFATEGGILPKPRQRGLSLIQLMVALTIGALITTGLIQLLISTKRTYRAQEAQARVQEIGRFSMDLVGYEVRMAGFMGCPNLDRVTPRVVANPAPSPTFSATNFIQAYEANVADWTPILPASLSTATLGNDVVTVHRGGDCAANLSAILATDDAAISIASGSGCGFSAGDYLLISDCVNVDVFRATNVSSSGGIETITHTTTNNTSARFSKTYGTDALIYKIQKTSFFVAPGAGGQPALWRQFDTDAAQELAEGVEGMQLLYGEDLNNDLSANHYVVSSTTGFSMSNVVSVRLNFLLRTLDANVTLAAQTYAFNGQTVTATDGRLRRTYVSTLNLRNRTTQ